MDGFLVVKDNPSVAAYYGGNENISLYQGNKLVYDGGKIKPGTILFEGNANGEIQLNDLRSWNRIKNGIEIEFAPLSNKIISGLHKYACVMNSWFNLQGNKLRIPVDSIKKGQMSFDSKIPREKIESNDINYGMRNSIDIKYWYNDELNNNYSVMHPMTQNRGDAEIQMGRFDFKNDTLNYIPYSLKVNYVSLAPRINLAGVAFNAPSPIISANIVKITAY